MELPPLPEEFDEAARLEQVTAEVRAVLDKHGCTVVGEAKPRYVPNGTGGWTMVIDTAVRIVRKG